MSSKTKIVVLHSKEVIYTAIFAALGIIMIILLVIMFSPNEKQETYQQDKTVTKAASYTPGVYSASITLNNSVIDIKVAVDENNINSIVLSNLTEAVCAMYPLIEPSFEKITAQIYESQSLDGVTYSEDQKYTSLVLLNAIDEALDKARIPED